jgi:hypothetical protein
MGWQDLAFAQQLRDVVRELAEKEIKRLRPTGQLATVDTIDTATNTCTVIFPGDAESVKVRMYTIQPTAGGGVGVGDVVRVSSDGARRYVSEVVNGSAFIRAGRMALATLQTTASSANVFVDAATGLLYRSTSSRRYKKNINTAWVSENSISRLRAVTHQQKGDDSGSTHLGLIAEELAELNDPVIDLLVVRDAEGNPDAINYDRLAVALLPIIQSLLQRVADLEEHVGE